ncbi:uncharacterized protein LOC115007581 [Cottoperca gobio]|uniref:Uncharacterized protein LOC115007581 n=1 Tax=Cottoperca gobio TaxID=56716 RepID=A0A6J2PM51_COTGO|nr:uncharacterized protein LOC115007581 [Cottoperca gobio]
MKSIVILYSLLYAAGIEGADIDVEGYEGGEVSFQCSHRLAWKNNKYLCKDPCEGSEDKLVTVKSGTRAESGRIALVDSGNGVFTVTFRRLQLSDRGRYWCAVDRLGYDTFIEVQLTVKEAVAIETTDKPERSPTWTHQNMSNSTQSTSSLDTSRPADLSTASENTNGGEQNSSTCAVVYATVGAFAVLIILMLAMIVRKRRESSKPQRRVCFNSTDIVYADETEACRGSAVKEVQSLKKTSERYSCTQHPEQDPPTSASTAADCSVPLHIYENIRCSKGTARSRYSAENEGDEHDISSVIYIKPLPPIPERTVKGFIRKHTNEPTATTAATGKPTESCTSNAPACNSRSCSNSRKVRPRSFWFGLDLSGTIEHTDTVFSPGCCLIVQLGKNLSVWTECKLGAMGATWISWRTTTTVIITLLQIQALISVKTTVSGVEGQRFDFRCKYENGQQSNAKYFCYDKDCNMSLIQTVKHDQWEKKGRFSLYDNTTGAFFIVSVDKLTSRDSGTYRCGVDVSLSPDHISIIQLNVFQANPPEHLTHFHMTRSPILPKDLKVDKMHLPLFVTAAMCVAAILFICLFTLCLWLAVKHRRSGPRHNREPSSDYETMMPGVRTEPELRCSFSAPDCKDLSALPPLPPDLCSHFTSKYRESTVTLGLGEYVDVDVPKHICQYQDLDLSRLEDHVYHSLQGNSPPKDGPQRVKDHINC